MRMKKFNLQFFADPDEGNNTEPTPEKTFTQTELDAVISKRLARERKAWEEQLEEEKKKVAMTEVEKLKAESEAKVKEWQEKYQTVAEKAKQAEVKAVAAELGVIDPEAAFLLVQNELTDEADPKEVLTKLLESKPYLKKRTDIGAPSNPGTPPEENPFLPETFNLSKQGEIFRRDPVKAKALQEQAKRRK
jgi:hypothetical protein